MQARADVLGDEDILAEILSYFPPVSIAKTAVISKLFQRVAKDNYYWKWKLKQHFPIYFSNMKKDNSVDWVVEFRIAYVKEYKLHDKKPLPGTIRKLFSLVKEGDIRRLEREWIFKLEDLEQMDANGFTLFDWAAKKNNQPVLDCFYRMICKSYVLNPHTYDLQRTDRQKRTLLHWAIFCHQPVQTVELLILAGADINALVYTKRIHGTAIHIASKEGQLAIVQWLIERSPTLLDHPDPGNQTPLMWAASRGHFETVDYLVKQGANLTLQSARESRLGAFHFACREGCLAIVKLLIEKQPDFLNQTDGCGQTPLMWAASRGQTAVVAYLIEQGADCDLQSSQHVGNTSGYTALHWACHMGHTEVAKQLIDNEAKLHLTATKRAHPQPIHLACMDGRLDIVQLLLEKQPDLLEQRDIFGQTPLLWAASEGHLAVVSYLAAKGADLNHQSTGHDQTAGYTALHWASLQGHTKTIQFLLDKTDIELTDHRGRTAADVAIKKTAYAYELQLLVHSKKIARKADDDYRSFTLFNRTYQYGYSGREEKEATNALIDVRFKGKDPSSLLPHQEVLQNGELKSIYRGLKIR